MRGRRYYLGAAAAVFVAFVLLALTVHDRGRPLVVDRLFARLIWARSTDTDRFHARPAILVWGARQLTVVGSPAVFIAATAAAFVAAIRRRDHALALAVLAAV